MRILYEGCISVYCGEVLHDGAGRDGGSWRTCDGAEKGLDRREAMCVLPRCWFNWTDDGRGFFLTEILFLRRCHDLFVRETRLCLPSVYWMTEFEWIRQFRCKWLKLRWAANPLVRTVTVAALKKKKKKLNVERRSSETRLGIQLEKICKKFR